MTDGLQSLILALIERGLLDTSRLSDREYVRAVLQEELDIRAKAGEFFWRKLTPSMIYALLQEEKLDRDRLRDAEYVKSVILANLDDLINAEIDVIIEYRGLFIPYARDAFAAGGLEAMVVLLVTAIEHRINSFYRQVLHPKLGDEMITEAIRSNMHTKMGWLMLLVSGHELPSELKTKINRLVEIRNAIVHYKFRPQSFEDMRLRYPVPQIEEIDIEETIEMIGELELVLESFRGDMCSDWRLAKEIATNVLGIEIEV